MAESVDDAIAVFAAWFKEMRRTSGLTQAAVASVLRVTDRALRSWESGASVPEEWRAGAIASALGADLRETTALLVAANRARRAAAHGREAVSESISHERDDLQQLHHELEADVRRAMFEGDGSPDARAAIDAWQERARTTQAGAAEEVPPRDSDDSLEEMRARMQRALHNVEDQLERAKRGVTEAEANLLVWQFILETATANLEHQRAQIAVLDDIGPGLAPERRAEILVQIQESRDYAREVRERVGAVRSALFGTTASPPASSTAGWATALSRFGGPTAKPAEPAPRRAAPTQSGWGSWSPGFGLLVQNRRQELRLSRAALASKMNMPVSEIDAWESGYAPSDLKPLASVLQWTERKLRSALSSHSVENDPGLAHQVTEFEKELRAERAEREAAELRAEELELRLLETAGG